MRLQQALARSSGGMRRQPSKPICGGGDGGVDVVGAASARPRRPGSRPSPGLMVSTCRARARRVPCAAVEEVAMLRQAQRLSLGRNGCVRGGLPWAFPLDCDLWVNPAVIAAAIAGV